MSRLLSILVLAAPLSAWAGPMCPSEAQRATWHAFADRLEASGTADEARAKALSKIDLGRTAIDRAEKIVPNAEGLATARGKLDALEAGVRSADTAHEVAEQFNRLDTQAAHCSYDTVEVVLIVIGFVLGILPGILFLLLFC